MTARSVFAGIAQGHVDPAVAIVEDGRVLAYCEEERLVRVKHAPYVYPMQALQYCLRTAGVELSDLAAVAVPHDARAYSDGRMARYFAGVRRRWQVDGATRSWQRRELATLNTDALTALHHRTWRAAFAAEPLPPVVGVPHHLAHAYLATQQSGFERSVCLTVDGSGDHHCTVVWHHDGEGLTPIREIRIPHSLGWFYAAITEYLGFQAYDGEYKVMGLAAYGRQDGDLAARLGQVVRPAPDGIEYRLDPRFIHYGRHSYSDRYTDDLVELLGRPPRRPGDEMQGWHEDVAFAAQDLLERSVERLLAWALAETGERDVCVCGGVGLNVKLNMRLAGVPGVRRLFPHPLCADSGLAAGAPLLLAGVRPRPLSTLALGPDPGDAEQVLRAVGAAYRRVPDVCRHVANLLCRGQVVAWVQGRLEAGPRALGQRSILADPRSVAMRDRVNAIVKHREYWRPFCPSLPEEAAETYLGSAARAPFMITAMPAGDRLREEAPAIVHVDGTVRPQTVSREVLPRYHRLLVEFGRLSGVPVLLNTSLNVSGEPIVASVEDALRTFWSTGIDALVVDDLVVTKEGAQAEGGPR